MYKIKYFSRDVVGEETKYNIETYTDYVYKDGELIEVQKERKIPYTEYKYEIKPKVYDATDEDFEYWLDVITKTYGKYGDITHEHIQDEPTESEKILQALDHLAREMTLSKLNNIRLKSDLSGVGEETVKIKLNDIEKER